MMINQAKNLLNEAYVARDESVSARDESVSSRDEAREKNDAIKDLLSEIEAKGQNMQSLLQRAELGVQASSESAAQAAGLLDKTNDAYEETLSISCRWKKT
jgi:predicted  nucleic acid-binding Zn-ribbon protein